ncbi:MAG: nucleoside monophosphate kinase [bacterium]|nr:nucleoside monophosphate kinase [bacterium]
MKDYIFPIFKTKQIPYKKFSLEDPIQRQKYFKYKAGSEINKIKKYLKKNTFVAFLMGKKNSGKGTYTKLFMEAVGSDNIAHISIGDIVRSVHKSLSNPKSKKDLISFLKQRYRGFISIEKAIDVILGRDTKTLLPAEIILALVEREISKLNKKAIFIDGFPRSLDQISYSLYFRALMDYRNDPDIFVFIDVPESVIDERIKNRVICPKCQTPRSLKLLRTKEVGYDKNKKEFFLMCDNQGCGKIRMVPKEGDELGIEPIRDRIELDDKISRTLIDLHGVPKVFLRNAIPQKEAKKMVDEYELTPSYNYEFRNGSILITEEPWTVKDEQGVQSHSLLPAAVAVALIKQVAKVLDL